MRLKNRYLTIQVQGDNVDKQKLYASLMDSLRYNFGDVGVSSVQQRLTVKYFNRHTKLGIVRSPLEHFRYVWAAMTLIERIGSSPCRIRVLRASGTIKSSQKFTIAYNKRCIDKVRDPAEQAVVERESRDLMELDRS